MKVWINSSARRALGVLVGYSVLVASTPVAVLVGASRNPDALMILSGVMVVSASAGFSIWLLMMIWETIKAGLVLCVLSLHHVVTRFIHRA